MLPRPSMPCVPPTLVCLLVVSGCEESPSVPEAGGPAFATTAEACAGDLVLTTQAEVDAFSCSEVMGDLTIGPSADITDLGSLSTLASVSGVFVIERNDVLADVDGLSGLTSVGWLIVRENGALADIDGLSSLVSASFFNLVDNDALTDVDGLSSLTSVEEWVIIELNDALTNVDGLSSLTSLGNDLVIEQNPRLSKCACALWALLADGIGGTLFISNNAPGCDSPGEVTAEACADCARMRLADVIAALEASDELGRGHARALSAKLDVAQKQADNGRYGVALGLLDTFMRQVVQLQNSGRIGSDTAQILLDGARTLRDAWVALDR
jgi:hypothetical protein